MAPQTSEIRKQIIKNLRKTIKVSHKSKKVKKQKINFIKRVAIKQLRPGETPNDVRRRLNISIGLPENHRIPFKTPLTMEGKSQLTGGSCCEMPPNNQLSHAPMKPLKTNQELLNIYFQSFKREALNSKGAKSF